MKVIHIIFYIVISICANAQDTVKLSESAYRLNSANYGFEKITNNSDSFFCYMEIVLPDTLTESGKPVFKIERIEFMRFFR